MLGFGFVREYFNKRAQARAEKEAADERIGKIGEAIDAGDNETVASLFEAAQGGPVPISLRALNFMVLQAVRADNEPALNTILASQESPNFWFFSHSGIIDGPTFYHNEHILHAAIASGSTGIALSLAKNPKVSVTDSGYSETSRYEHGSIRKDTKPYPSPLDAAENAGMDEVAAVIAKRLSEGRAVRAKHARARAHRMQ